jgi:hypothetical protein
MKTSAIKPENFRNIAEYARARGLGIGSFRLKDKSSIKVLSDTGCDTVEVYQVKNGKIIDRQIFKGPDEIPYAAMHIASLEKAAESVEELNKAWAQSMYKESDMF